MSLEVVYKPKKLHPCRLPIWFINRRFGGEGAEIKCKKCGQMWRWTKFHSFLADGHSWHRV